MPSIEVNLDQGSSTPVDETLHIANDGAQGSSLDAQVVNLSSVTSVSSQTTGPLGQGQTYNLTVIVNPSGLEPGTDESDIVIEDPQAQNDLEVVPIDVYVAGSNEPVEAPPGGISTPPVTGPVTTVDPNWQGSWMQDLSDARVNAMPALTLMVGPNSGSLNFPVAGSALGIGSGRWNSIEATLTSPQMTGQVMSFFATVHGQFTAPGGTTQLSTIIMQFDCAQNGTARARFFDAQGNQIQSNLIAIDLVRG